jgi:hypothetical protein
MALTCGPLVHDGIICPLVNAFDLWTISWRRYQWSCEFESRWWRGVLDTTLCNKVCQGLATSRWFSPGPPLSSTNKTNLHYITEILSKVALNTIKQTKTYFKISLKILASISGMLTWRLVLLVEDKGGPGENHRSVARHWQTLSHNVVHLTLIEIRNHSILNEC